MIKSFKHKGLKKFYETGTTTGIHPSHKTKLRVRLIALDTATCIDDMEVPGFELHQLQGSRKGTWTISVSGNWRITFRMENGHTYVLNYEDYH